MNTLTANVRPAKIERVDMTPSASFLMAELERHLAWTAELKQADQEDGVWDGWCDAGTRIYDRVETLPNTPVNLDVRALAITCLVGENADPALIDQSELAAYANGIAGRLIKQVLSCILQQEG